MTTDQAEGVARCPDCQDGQVDGETCPRCAGNGEIVTNWDRYLGGNDCTLCDKGEWPKHALTCPECDAELPDD